MEKKIMLVLIFIIEKLGYKYTIIKEVPNRINIFSNYSNKIEPTAKLKVRPYEQNRGRKTIK